MHSGTFPDHYHPKAAHADREEKDLVADLPESGGLLSRRQWLFGAACAVVAGGSGLVFAGRGRDEASARHSTDRSPKSVVSPAPRRGSLAWALSQAQAPEAELVAASGDLERVSAQHRQESRLRPVFVRLLEVSLVSRHEFADMAGACAVRSLARIGQSDVVMEWQSRIEAMTERPETIQALSDAMTRRRRRGGRR